ncbi:MAG: Bug family tripartite tricarboxylate transporter substrate binding protein [Tagaea sp.]
MSGFARRAFLAGAGLASAGAFATIPAFAQGTWPQRPVRFVVPFPPGGPADVLARSLGERLGNRLGRSFTIENRPGAGTAIGTRETAQSAPDGHTIMIGTVSSHAMNPALNRNVGYDPIADFAPIAGLASVPFYLVVHPRVAARSVAEFVALAHAQPGRLNYASAGIGTSNHLAGEFFKLAARADIAHIPYRGSAPALQGVIAGETQAMFDLSITALPQIEAGTVRALAVASPRRLPRTPDVPALAETFPGFEASAWFGIFAPARTPEAIVSRLAAEIDSAFEDPAIRERLAQQGADPLRLGPGPFATFVREEHARWGRVIRDADIKPEG